jgi:BMFP domain-containing protein YqiC
MLSSEDALRTSIPPTQHVDAVLRQILPTAAAAAAAVQRAVQTIFHDITSSNTASLSMRYAFIHNISVLLLPY